MEDILDVYELPYNPERPVECMDKKPSPLIGNARKALPMRPGDNQKIDNDDINSQLAISNRGRKRKVTLLVSYIYYGVWTGYFNNNKYHHVNALDTLTL